MDNILIAAPSRYSTRHCLVAQTIEPLSSRWGGWADAKAGKQARLREHQAPVIAVTRHESTVFAKQDGQLCSHDDLYSGNQWPRRSNARRRAPLLVFRLQVDRERREENKGGTVDRRRRKRKG